MADPSFHVYQPQDRPVCEEIIRSQVGKYLAEGEEQDFKKFLDRLDTGDPQMRFWLVGDGEQVVGCGGLVIDGDRAKLSWGILRDGSLSKGFGRALLRHRLEFMKTNCPEIRSVLVDTAPLTEGFFAKHGFVTYRRQANYWAGKLELVAMELKLEAT